jgi:hypothetical protein
MEIPTYATLINRKLLLPSSKKPFLAVDEHFLAQLLKPRIEKIHVDEDWYLRTYSDVSAAIQSGVVPNAKAHYCQYGFYEHRMPHCVMVDENWYLAEYPDVNDGVKSKHFASGQDHFEIFGYREGRYPYQAFELQQDHQ